MEVFYLKYFILVLSLIFLFSSSAFAYSISAPEGKTLKVHWAVLEAEKGKMQEMAEISSRTVAKFTPNEKGSYALYGAVAKENPDLMRILEIYEDEEAYEIHRSSEGFKNFLEERKPILKNLTILPVDPIVLEQKSEGVGTVAIMILAEAKPECLEAFKNILVKECKRGVKDEDGVLGLFATAEKGERSNVIHMLEIYKDAEAQKKYIDSDEFKKFVTDSIPLLSNFKMFENYPTKITLTKKGIKTDMKNENNLSAFPIGEKNDAYAQYFDGQSYLAVLSKEQVFIANVTFEPGCRNHWHIHHAEKGGGQILVCVYGRGWYQEWGKPARALKAGDVVNIPANVKHWHGAAKDSWFQHLAIEVEGEKTSNEWCESVSQEDYEALK